jgi:Holliday junction resolvase-like predicted endonuclease
LIAEFGQTAVAYKCDVTKVKEVSEVSRRVRCDLGEVDILVNNAGVISIKTILELEEKDIRRTLEVNTLAQFWVSNILHLSCKFDIAIVPLPMPAMLVVLAATLQIVVVNCLRSIAVSSLLIQRSP